MDINNDILNKILQEVSPGATILESVTEGPVGDVFIYVRFEPLVFDLKYSKILRVSMNEYQILYKQKQREDNLKIILDVPKN